MPLNVESARIERAMGRTVIPQFHAAFSIGAVAGSALGARASHLGISVAAAVLGRRAVAVVWRLALAARASSCADAPGDRRGTLGRRDRTGDGHRSAAGAGSPARSTRGASPARC